jgi:hypothetical protein
VLALALFTFPIVATAQEPAVPPASAPAQAPAPQAPGPYVIDLRGNTIGIPSESAFFPPLAEGTSVPARAFGLDVGVHFYPFALGSARIGLGANALLDRGRIGSSDVTTTVKALSPQISFNFGTREGWSYLSAGYGVASLRTEAPLVTIASTTTSSNASDTPATVTGGLTDSGTAGTANFGGGARWFLSEHAALSFDVRFHRLAATATTPRVTLVAVSVGLSLR